MKSWESAQKSERSRKSLVFIGVHFQRIYNTPIIPEFSGYLTLEMKDDKQFQNS